MQSNGQIFKFTLNIKIYKKFEGFLSKLVWRYTLFKVSLLAKWEKSYSRLGLLAPEELPPSILNVVTFECFIWPKWEINLDFQTL